MNGISLGNVANIDGGVEGGRLRPTFSKVTGVRAGLCVQELAGAQLQIFDELLLNMPSQEQLELLLEVGPTHGHSPRAVLTGKPL